MADTQRRHLEFFGPDLARGPVLSGAPDTAGIQIAAALAQLRTPLLRSDDDIRAHVDFIRELADRMFPDVATALHIDVGPLAGGAIVVSVRAPVSAVTLLDIWLADVSGSGVSGTSPISLTFTSGTVVEEVVANLHYRILTTSTGIAQLAIAGAGPKSWYLAAARSGRVLYSAAVHFPA